MEDEIEVIDNNATDGPKEYTIINIKKNKPKEGIVLDDVISEDIIINEDENKEIEDITEKEPEKETESEKEVEDTSNDDASLSMKIIEEYGENFSKKEYITNPAIGRDKEIGELIVTLLTPEKSAILVGKPGIGKTAIVEGLGYKIKNGDVPNALKGYTIIKLNTASLTGTMPNTNELKIQYIVNQLKNLDKIMIFIDEIHTLIGTGDKTLDFANIFKPIIDRGTIKIIGATTSDEYNRYILRDKAFVRRFQKIDVAEPTREMVIQIMMGTYPKFEKKMGLKLKYTDFIKEKIMTFIVEMTDEYKRVYEVASRYPDICLAIVSNAFSYALYDNEQVVKMKHFYQAICNAKNIYEDVKVKEIERFKVEFKDLILEENVNLEERG